MATTTQYQESHEMVDWDNESIESMPDDDFEPIEFSDLPKDDAGLPKYRQPNYKPLVLRPWFLILFSTWLAMCVLSVTTISVLGYLKPPWLHLGTISGHRAWVYAPGTIAATSSIIFSAVLNQYFNIMPFAEMANVDLHKGRGVDMLSSAEVALMEPGGNIFTLFHFIKKGFYLAALLIWNFYGAAILTVLKSAFIQPVKDTEGWKLGVSYIIGFVAMILYLLMCISTVWIYLYFDKHITGLRWSPNSIASRISLVQGSNVLTAFRKTEVVKSRKQMSLIANSWAKEQHILRVGYWKNTKTGLIFHGIRFVKTTGKGKAIDHQEGVRRHIFGPGPESRTSQYQMPARIPDAVEQDHAESSSASQDQRRGISEPRSSLRPSDLPHEAYIRAQYAPRQSTDQVSSDGIYHDEDEGKPLLDIKMLAKDQRKKTLREAWLDPKKALKALDEEAKVERISNVFLSDWWIFSTFITGVGIIVTTLVFIAQGRIYDVHTSYFMDKLYQIPHIGLFLPAFLLSFFNIVFVSSDLYHRAMIPIQNMSRLPNGAMAKSSVLLDYISSDPVTALLVALAAKDFRIAWGIFLSNACGYSYVVFGRVFIFGDEVDSGIQFQVHQPSLYGALVILIGYCAAILFARPRGAVRSCWPVYNLIWTINLCYQSPILRCPEFWAQRPKDDCDHLEAQIILADRSYAFGLHKGLDNRPHLGIGSASLPVWDIEANDVHERLDQSSKVSRGVMKAGCYDVATYKGAQQFLDIAESTWKWEMFVWKTTQSSWKAWFPTRLSTMLGRSKTRRPDEEEANDETVVTMSEIQPTSIRRHMSDRGRSLAAYQPVDLSITQAYPRKPVPNQQSSNIPQAFPQRPTPGEQSPSSRQAFPRRPVPRDQSSGI